MRNPRYWEEDDPEDVLWVCPVCDAHLHADCVGETCPACGSEAEDDPVPPLTKGLQG